MPQTDRLSCPLNLILVSEPGTAIKLARQWSPNMHPLDGNSMYHTNEEIRVLMGKYGPHSANKSGGIEPVTCTCKPWTKRKKPSSVICLQCDRSKLSSKIERDLEQVFMRVITMHYGQVQDAMRLVEIFLHFASVIGLCYKVDDPITLKTLSDVVSLAVYLWPISPSPVASFDSLLCARCPGHSYWISFLERHVC